MWQDLATWMLFAKVFGPNGVLLFMKLSSLPLLSGFLGVISPLQSKSPSVCKAKCGLLTYENINRGNDAINYAKCTYFRMQISCARWVLVCFFCLISTFEIYLKLNSIKHGNPPLINTVHQWAHFLEWQRYSMVRCFPLLLSTSQGQI